MPTRLHYALRVCAAVGAVTVSSGSSCYKATTPSGQTGSIRGSVSSSKGGGLSGVTVTATRDSGGDYVATTDAGGDFLLTGVKVGEGTIALTGVGPGCTAPTPVSYAVLAMDTTLLQFTVTCIVTLP